MSLIALGVSGGIGAYKAVEVARGLQKQGHDVVAVMTRHARKFVGPLTFEVITRHKVLTDQFAPGTNSDIEHISLATSIDLLLVAPATANVIGKFANGIADDFLTSLYIATKAPVLLAPAMNTHMLEHAAVRSRDRAGDHGRRDARCRACAHGGVRRRHHGRSSGGLCAGRRRGPEDSQRSRCDDADARADARYPGRARPPARRPRQAHSCG